MGILILLLSLPAWSMPSGRTHFLSYGPGAAEEAVGGAAVGMSQGPTSLYYNSAGLAKGPAAASAEWTRLGPGLSYSWIGASADLKYASLGLGVINLSLGDITARSNLSDPGASISSYQRAYLLGSAREVSPGLFLGSTLGLLDYNLAGYSSRAIFGDIGCSYRIMDKLTAGLSIKNFYFSGLSFGGEREYYPREIRLGGSWQVRGVDILAQAAKILDGSSPNVTVGATYALFKLFRLRGGFDGYPAFGFGLNAIGGRFAIDFSYQARAINSSQRITLNYLFKAPEAVPPQDAYSELRQRSDSLASYFTEESKRLLETRDRRAGEALKKLLALEPGNADVAQALSAEAGETYRALRLTKWALTPWESRKRRHYLRFSVSFAEGSAREACLTGAEFRRKWPTDGRSRLIAQFLAYRCEAK